MIVLNMFRDSQSSSSAGNLKTIHIIFILAVVNLSFSSNILVVIPYMIKSHFIVFDQYLQSLAARGHKLLVISHYPKQKPLCNYVDIDLKDSTNELPLEELFGSGNGDCMKREHTFSLDVKSAINTKNVGRTSSSQNKTNKSINFQSGDYLNLQFCRNKHSITHHEAIDKNSSHTFHIDVKNQTKLNKSNFCRNIDEEILENYSDYVKVHKKCIPKTTVSETNTSMNFFTFEMIANGNLMKGTKRRYDTNLKTCEDIFVNTNVIKILSSKVKFDILLAELFVTDCFLAFSHIFQIPIIALLSCYPVPWANSRYGNPDNPSYIPVVYGTYSSRMNFIERMINSVSYTYHKLIYSLFHDGPAYKIAVKHLGSDLPPLSEMAKNTSLVLVNSHFSLNSARPNVPGVVEVAGIHISPPGILPQVS